MARASHSRFLYLASAAASRLLAAFGLMALSFGAAQAGSNDDAPMRFMLVHGDMDYCRSDKSCPDWISAEGQIVAGSPASLQRLLKSIGDRKLPIIVRSPGGDVAAAMQMGLIIRKKGLSIAVGGTHLTDCPDTDALCTAGREGSAKGEVYSDGGVCFSACPLFLAGGVRRVAAPVAMIGVHQITTTYREERVRYRTEYEIVHGKKKVLAEREIGRKLVGQHDTTKLNKKQKAALIAYLTKMGVDSSIFDLMMSATPASIRLIPSVEALQLKMTTEPASAAELVMANRCAGGLPIESCVLPVTAPPPPPAPDRAPGPSAPATAAPPAMDDDVVFL